MKQEDTPSQNCHLAPVHPSLSLPQLPLSQTCWTVCLYVTWFQMAGTGGFFVDTMMEQSGCSFTADKIQKAEPESYTGFHQPSLIIWQEAWRTSIREIKLRRADELELSGGQHNTYSSLNGYGTFINVCQTLEKFTRDFFNHTDPVMHVFRLDLHTIFARFKPETVITYVHLWTPGATGQSRSRFQSLSKPVQAPE